MINYKLLLIYYSTVSFSLRTAARRPGNGQAAVDGPCARAHPVKPLAMGGGRVDASSSWLLAMLRLFRNHSPTEAPSAHACTKRRAGTPPRSSDARWWDRTWARLRTFGARRGAAAVRCIAWHLAYEVDAEGEVVRVHEGHFGRRLLHLRSPGKVLLAQTY